ncbi:MAG TPA: N-acetylmuramoyl-L-alanine amidase [Vicinamibacterales bacterium]|nr:N-acetylmuramoyl-L-alanine amidase [Vicinamibacterales bacterium]
MRISGSGAALVVLIGVAWPVMPAEPQGPRASYEQTREREKALRRDLDGLPAGATSEPLLARIRGLVSTYETLSRRYPRSGYSDNALWQGATLSADAFWQFGEDADRQRALRLFEALASRFPTSSLVRQIGSHKNRLEAAASTAVRLEAIRREILRDVLRVTLALDREPLYREERLDQPARVLVDLQNTRPVESLKDRVLAFSDDVVRQIRVGRSEGTSTRVVIDLEGIGRHSVYPLYDPYRLVIDLERVAEFPGPDDTPRRACLDPRLQVPSATSNGPGASSSPAPAPPVSPRLPAANVKGGFSLSRQLGLGISRVVVDAGHGGHDPGARVTRLTEADLVLDVALRLEALLLKQPGVEVVMTRRENVYVPLEERTAIANRVGADLFLSIHANASRNSDARGIETYFLNFALNRQAEALAARENAGSSRTMSNLPDIVKTIALNNKINESRDFASMVQMSMYERLRRANKEVRSLGVKQAPFMVLIGATMPSILAEISFVTNRPEASRLRTGSYRQQIAEALFNGVVRYQKSLKGQAVAVR